MSKTIHLLCFLSLALGGFGCLAALGDDFTLPAIDQTWWGIWIPESFATAYRQDCNYQSSLAISRSHQAHDILVVEKDRIWSDVGFHDGYAINRQDYSGFRLSLRGQNPVLMDNHGNSYRRLTTGSQADMAAVYGAFLLEVLKEKVEAIATDISLTVLPESARVLVGPQSHPSLNLSYDLVLDLFAVMGTLDDPARFNLYLMESGGQELLGLRLLADRVELYLLHRVRLMDGHHIESGNQALVPQLVYSLR